MTKSAKLPAFYACRCCGRNTNSKDRDASGTGLCTQCYELSGLENAQSDSAGGKLEEGEIETARAYVTELNLYGRTEAVAAWMKTFGLESLNQTAAAPAAGTGPKLGRQHAVQVTSPAGVVTTHSSTYKAFVALGLPVAKHVAFRKTLKELGAYPFQNEAGLWGFKTL